MENNNTAHNIKRQHFMKEKQIILLLIIQVIASRVTCNQNLDTCATTSYKNNSLLWHEAEEGASGDTLKRTCHARQ